MRLRSFKVRGRDAPSGLKRAAEELIRGSGLDYSILKAGMIYGRGDHLSHTVQILPAFATVGIREKPIRPILPIDDLTDILVAAIDGRMPRETVAVVYTEQLQLPNAVRRVASVVNRRVVVVPWPVWAQHTLAQMTEWTVKVPLVAKAKVRTLARGSSPAWVAHHPITRVSGGRVSRHRGPSRQHGREGYLQDGPITLNRAVPTRKRETRPR